MTALGYVLSGFSTQTSTVTVTAGQAVTTELKLQIAAQAEAVQVTGTLIPRPTLEAMSPVTTLEVEELTYRGINRVEDLLTTLPQVFVAQNSAVGFTAPQGNVWNDGPSDFNVPLGSKLAGDKGHVAFYLDYRTTNAITKDARDYTNCSVLGGVTIDGPACGGSSTTPAGRFLVFDPNGNPAGDFTLDTNPTTDPNGNLLRPRTGADVYNYAPYNYMQRPDKRWAAGAFMNYDHNKHLGFYGDVMLMDDTTDSQVAPSGDFGETTQVNCNNPMLSAQEVNLLCTAAGYGPTDTSTVVILRRSVESGNRTDHLTHTTFRITFGAKGDINDAWKYDVYGLQAQMRAPDDFANDLSIPNLQNALLVTGTPGQPATWACTNDSANCKPWDIFQVGGVTPAAIGYVSLPLIYSLGARTRIVSGKITGDLKDYGIVSPMATDGFKVAVGAEKRQEEMFFAPDAAYQDFLGAGQGGPRLPVSGEYSVKELFGEGLFPLVQDKTFVKDFSVEAGYRLSDYTNTGSHSTYKLQASYAPTPDVKLRVGFNRATRSPNIVELYTPQGLTLNGVNDLCAGTTPVGTLAQCELTGVTAAQYGHIQPNPAGQYNTLSGGNAALSPETANTWTGGLVLTPTRFVPGFTLALDYYHIRINNTIGSLQAPDIMNNCIATGNPTLCGLIHRDQFGSLWIQPTGYTITTNQNVGMLLTEGLDVNGTYTRPIPHDWGDFSVNLIGTYLRKDETNTGVFDYDCAGFYGNTCGIPLPRWRHLARFTWETPWHVTLSAGWRFIGSTLIDEASSNPSLANPGNIAADKASFAYQLAVANYLDIGATWKIHKGVEFIAGVNNVFDKEPPLGAGSSPNDFGTGFFGTYDPLGRFIHTGLQVTF